MTLQQVSTVRLNTDRMDEATVLAGKLSPSGYMLLRTVSFTRIAFVPDMEDLMTVSGRRVHRQCVGADFGVGLY